MPKQSAKYDTHAVENQPGDGALPESGSNEIVAKLAYRLWLQRGSPEGTPEEDWYRAEQLLQSGTAVSSASSIPAS
jgi:DUF2934 family protein